MVDNDRGTSIGYQIRWIGEGCVVHRGDATP